MAISKKEKTNKKLKKIAKGSKRANNKDIVERITEQVETEAKKPLEIKKRRTDLTFANTGSTLLDLSSPFVFGKIVNIVGDNSTGKTLLAMECIAQTRKILGNKLKWKYDDAESGFSFDSKEMYGVELLSAKEQASETVEDFEYNLNKELDDLKDKEYLIYVIDCMDALKAKEEENRFKKRIEYEAALRAGKSPKDLKGTYGMEKPKKMGELFRNLVQKIEKKNCLLIIISQVRMNIDAMFGNKYTRVGGKALDFYASVIIWLAVLEKNKIKNIPVGVVIKAKNTKNKITKPFRIVNTHILFDYGIDDITSNIEYLYELRTPTGDLKSKSEKVNWDDMEYTLKGLVKHIENNSLEDELKKRVEQKWYEFEASITPNRKRKF